MVVLILMIFWISLEIVLNYLVGENLGVVWMLEVIILDNIVLSLKWILIII